MIPDQALILRIRGLYRVEEVLALQGENLPFGINSILNTALADEAMNRKRPKYTR